MSLRATIRKLQGCSFFGEFKLLTSNPKSPLNLFEICEDYSEIAGGIPAVVDQLSGRISADCNKINILCVREDPMPPQPGVEVVRVKPDDWCKAWGWSKQLSSSIALLCDDMENQVVHIHGIWMAPQWLAAKIADKNKIPFVISSHGMLEPWLWDEQGWRVKLKKHAYWKIMAYPAFKKASIVHAITPLERDHLHALFPDRKIEIIPNAIDFDQASIRAESLEVDREPIILFLGRLDPKKGVDLLLQAFVKANLPSKWRLVIVGPPWSSDYYSELTNFASQSGMSNRIEFIGPVFGEEKLRWLKRAWVLAVPSYSEVVGLVNLEAAVNGTPSITTFETGLFNWEEGGGMLIHPTVDEISGSLKAVCSWSELEHQDRGEKSKQLIKNYYSWNVVLPQWVDLYRSLKK